MGVLQADRSARGLADVRNDIERADRLAAHELGDRRARRKLGVEEHAYSFALEKGDAPGIAVLVGAAPMAYFEFTRVWWFSDGMGLLLVTPLVLSPWPPISGAAADRPPLR
jgi:hypothetical protein